MQINKKQQKTFDRILKGNPLLNWSGWKGFYSDNTVIFKVVWKDNPDQICLIKINENGEIE